MHVLLFVKKQELKVFTGKLGKANIVFTVLHVKTVMRKGAA